MNKTELKKLTKSQLTEILLKQNEGQPKKSIVSNNYEPIPAPRKSVKQMVKKYEENIILPLPQFRDNYKPVPAPRT